MSVRATRFCDTCGKELIPEHVGGETCNACLVVILSGSVPDDFGEVDDDELDEAADELAAELAEPEPGDWVTTDHVTFREHEGRGWLQMPPNVGDGWIQILKDRMDRDQFWPSVWFLSDHGNYHLLRLSDG